MSYRELFKTEPIIAELQGIKHDEPTPYIYFPSHLLDLFLWMEKIDHLQK